MSLCSGQRFCNLPSKISLQENKLFKHLRAVQFLEVFLNNKALLHLFDQKYSKKSNIVNIFAI